MLRWHSRGEYSRGMDRREFEALEDATLAPYAMHSRDSRGRVPTCCRCGSAGDHFTTPFCCYGNDVDCDRCGAWAVFHIAAKLGIGETPEQSGR